MCIQSVMPCFLNSINSVFSRNHCTLVTVIFRSGWNCLFPQLLISKKLMCKPMITMVVDQNLVMLEDSSLLCCWSALSHTSCAEYIDDEVVLKLTTHDCFYWPRQEVSQFLYDASIYRTILLLSLIHIWRCRRIERCRSRWSPYH